MKWLIDILKATVITLAGFFLLAFIYAIHGHNKFYQGVRSQESNRVAKHVTSSIAAYHSKHKKYPDTIFDVIDAESINGTYVGNIEYENQLGVLSVMLAGDSPDEGILVFSPTINSDGELSYKCQPKDVPSEYIPEDCHPLNGINQQAESPSEIHNK
jgi:hypothetical protein